MQFKVDWIITLRQTQFFYLITTVYLPVVMNKSVECEAIFPASGEVFDIHAFVATMEERLMKLLNR